MAYVNNDKTKQVRNDLKAAFPSKSGWKFSVRKRHSSSVDVVILKSPIDWEANLGTELQYNKDLSGVLTTEGEGLRSCSISFPQADWFGGEAGKALKKILEIINVGNFDKSDIMTDYFHVGFYFDLTIGEYDRPCLYTGPAKIEEAPVAELEAEETTLTEEEIEYFDAMFASDVLPRTDAAEMGIYFDESTEVTEEQIAYIETREVSAANVAFIFTGEKGEGCTVTGGNIAEAKAMIAGAKGKVAPAILEVPTPTGGNIFEDAEVISRYTRAQAIEDGFLADVSEVAKEAGIVYPVAITSALHYDISNIPESHGYQDYSGRLWDVLYMFAIRARNHSGGPGFKYEIIMHNGRKKYYTIKAHLGPGDNGEPVITLMRPNED